jgi:hypothetical protein
MPRIKPAICALAAVAVALVAGPSRAQTASDSQRRFADAFVAALDSGQVRRLRALVHPATLACEAGPARDYVEAMFSRVMQDGARFGPAYRIHQVTPMDGAAPVPANFPFPAQPSYRMQIDSETPGRPMAMNIWLAPAGEGWLAVYPCPTAAGMNVFRENQAR